jgi:pilus assembly protein CpaF
LKDGSRINAIIPPLSLKEPCITIRKFRREKLQITDLIRYGSLSPQMAEFLELCVQSHRNMVISGGTGSGKTTLLNILTSFIGKKERIVTIEDAAELQIYQPHWIQLESRPANLEGKGQVTIRDLVKNCLRMRPDRIVVGECRSGETLDMLQAMNTGHDGSLTTLHANTPRDALARMETMCLMGGLDLPLKAIRDQIASAIHVIVQQTRFSDGSRRVQYITEVAGMEVDIITLQDIFVFKQDGVNKDGKVLGRFVPTGFMPKFFEDLSRAGISINPRIFKVESEPR